MSSSEILKNFSDICCKVSADEMVELLNSMFGNQAAAAAFSNKLLGFYFLQISGGGGG